MKHFNRDFVKKYPNGQFVESHRFTNDVLRDKVDFFLRLYPNGSDESNRDYTVVELCRESKVDVQISVEGTISAFDDGGAIKESFTREPNTASNWNLWTVPTTTVLSKRLCTDGTLKFRFEGQVVPFLIQREAIPEALFLVSRIRI